MSIWPRCSVLTVLILGLIMSPALADVSLHPIFSNHMVLQRERPVPVWGKAAPGEKVSVSFGGETINATAASDGKWMAVLSPKPVSATPQELVVTGASPTNILTVKDILVGDVWLGTGQSNMDFSLNSTDRAEEIKKMPPGTFAGIRLFKVKETQLDEPTDTLGGEWLDAETKHIVGFSATLFYFGEELHNRMPGVPLGLVRSSVGATNLYCWIPNDLRDKDPSAESLRTWWANSLKGWTPAKQAQRDQEMEDYLAKVEEFKQRNESLPAEVKKPGELMGPKWSRRPSALYNGMIAPLQPFAIRGMIWYQGEWDSKSNWIPHYHDMFVAFAQSLRSKWTAASGKKESGQFPIYLVQLPAREAGDGDFWAYMREVQERIATSVPNSGFVSTYDTNDPKDLHPRAKSPVGKRLARLALAKEYGQKIAWTGPVFISAKPTESGMLLSFHPGACAENLKSKDGQPLRGFELAGNDGKYYAATGEIRSGNEVFVSSKEVPTPQTVRYAFLPTVGSAAGPDGVNFYNSEDLPARPFRTDTQPMPIKGK